MKLTKLLSLLLISSILITGCSSNNTETESNDSTSIENAIDVEDIETSGHEIEYFTVTANTPMENRGLKLELLGAKIYDEIKGEAFTDTPSDGNKYLVLFLSIKNRTGKDEYFNYNNLITKLDGKEITDTFLINEPLKYTTIKNTLPNGMITQGYLVWEVPEDWKKLEVTYTGWTESYYTEPTIVVTPEELEEPGEYKEDNRII